MSYIGMKGKPCPVCAVHPIGSQHSRTCSSACGIKLRDSEAKQARGAPVETASGNTSSATVTKTTARRVKTLQDLIEVCEIDTKEWEVERWVCEKYDTVSVPRTTGNDKDGWSRPDARPRITESFLVKAWLRRKTTVISARAEIEAMLADARKHAPRYAAIKRTPRASGNLLEVNITDHHFGKLAWAKETGYADYDLGEADRLFDTATEALIARASSLIYDRSVVVIGNDLMHADNKRGQTTRGTQLTTDSRYQKVFTTARRAAVRLIDRVRNVAPVQVIVVPGNHDEVSAFCLGDALECWYHDCPDVTVDNAPTMRKYLQWGRVMLMWTHGNAGKLEDYPLLMATEQREMWGATTWREAHTGDKHHRKLIELHGVAVRILPTLCPPDDWHSDMHFVGQQRCAEAYMWNRDEGMLGTVVYSVPESAGKAA